MDLSVDIMILRRRERTKVIVIAEDTTYHFIIGEVIPPVRHFIIKATGDDRLYVALTKIFTVVCIQCI